LRRRLRRLRAVAALATTALIAPLGVAGVATVTTASPAAAAPGDTGPIVVTGDAAARNTQGAGAWTWQQGAQGNDFSQLKSLITNAANFGPSGTVKATFDVTTVPAVTEVTDAALANVDVYFASGVAGGYTPDEQAALKRFVEGGGVVIANSSDAFFDTTTMWGAPVAETPARWEDYNNIVDEHSGTHGCTQHPGPVPAANDCVSEFSAPAAAQAIGSHAILQGPFGTVTSYRNWHTVDHFTATPAGSQTLATLSVTCAVNSSVPQTGGLSCARTNEQIQEGALADASDDCDFNTADATLPDCPEQAFNNNVGLDQPMLAVIPFGNAATGAGAVVLSADVDTFGNRADFLGGNYGNDPMQTGNRILTLNTFAWIANQLRPGGTTTEPPVVPATEKFTPVSPQRLLDTRNGIGGAAAKLGANETRSLTFPAGVSAVALNITGTNSSDLSFLKVFPGGGSSPEVSNVNLVPGKDVSNSTVVRVGTGGVVTLQNGPGTTDAIVDIVGTYQATTGDVITSLAPVRLVDSRTGLGGVTTPLAAGESRAFDIRGLSGGSVPADATGVVLNVTATNASTGGFFTVYPSDLGAVPGTSNVNFQAGGRATPGLVFTELSADGRVSVFNGLGTADVIIDLFGYFAPTAGGGSNGLLAPVTPARLLDTRNATTIDGQFVNGGPLGADVSLKVAGRGGVPATGATTVVLNVTVNQPTAQGFLTVWPEGAMPTVSNLNFEGGQTVANLVAVKVGADGNVRFHADAGNLTGNVQVIADVVGYYN
jgi:hypothetical protein